MSDSKTKTVTRKTNKTPQKNTVPRGDNASVEPMTVDLTSASTVVPDTVSSVATTKNSAKNATAKNATAKNATAKNATTKNATTKNATTKDSVAKTNGNLNNEQSADAYEELDKRYFKCIMITSDDNVIATGRYCGKKPKQAASKACTKLYDDIIESGRDMPENIIFGMHECTRSSKRKKKYFYSGKRVKLAEPEHVEINKTDLTTGKKMVITYYYNNDVRKLTNVDTHEEYLKLANYDTRDVPEQTGGKKAVKKRSTPKKVAVKKRSTPKKVAVQNVDNAPENKTVVKKENNIKVKKTDTKRVQKAPAKS
jgi:hypothetical protein